MATTYDMSIPTPTRRSSYGYEAEFDSVAHAVHTAGAFGMANDPRSVPVTDSAARRRDQWTNNVGAAEVRRYLEQPKEDLVRAVDRMRERLSGLTDSPTRERRKLRRNREDGIELDPLAVEQRRLDCWTEVDHVRVPRHYVRVAINVTMVWNMTADMLLWRGAAACAIADLLSQSGHSVELVGFVAVDSLTEQCRSLLLRVPIKPADAPLDLATVALSLCEIGFFRVVLMPCLGRVTPGAVQPGFGSVRGLTPEEREGFDVVLDAGVLDADSAERAVRTAVAKFNAEEGVR